MQQEVRYSGGYPPAHVPKMNNQKRYVAGASGFMVWGVWVLVPCSTLNRMLRLSEGLRPEGFRVMSKNEIIMFSRVN